MSGCPHVLIEVISHPMSMIFDNKKTKANRNRCAKNIGDHSFLFDLAMKSMEERLKEIKRDFKAPLQIGTRGKAFHNKNTVFMDIAESIADKAHTLEGSGRFVLASEEYLPFAEESFDLVINNMSLHSINDIPLAILNIRKTLKPDGFFIASLFGVETLGELRKSFVAMEGSDNRRLHPLPDKQQMGDMMQACGFALPVVDCDIITVEYDNALALMKDIKGMGEANALIKRNKKPLGKKLLGKICEYYEDNFPAGNNGKTVIASFEIIYLAGWAPHESQQQPLTPGCASCSLTEVL